MRGTVQNVLVMPEPTFVAHTHKILKHSYAKFERFDRAFGQNDHSYST